MAFITDKLGERIYLRNYVPKSKVLAEGTNINNLPTSTIIEGKIIHDIYYSCWRGILRRCKETGDTVCDEWMEFSNFKSWASKYSLVGKELNHTILVPGNTHYSPKTCVFIPPSLAKLFTVHSDNESGLTGVTFVNDSRYRARISIDGKQKHLGYYDTVEVASNVFILAKAEEANRVADEYTGDKMIAVKMGIKQHIKLLKNQLT